MSNRPTRPPSVAQTTLIPQFIRSPSKPPVQRAIPKCQFIPIPLFKLVLSCPRPYPTTQPGPAQLLGKGGSGPIRGGSMPRWKPDRSPTPNRQIPPPVWIAQPAPSLPSKRPKWKEGNTYHFHLPGPTLPRNRASPVTRQGQAQLIARIRMVSNDHPPNPRCSKPPQSSSLSGAPPSLPSKGPVPKNC